MSRESLLDAVRSVEEFNRSSGSIGADWGYPSDTSIAVERLAALADLLSRAVAQSVIPACEAHKRGRLFVFERDASVELDVLLGLIGEAGVAAEALAGALGGAREVASRMGFDLSDLAP